VNLRLVLLLGALVASFALGCRRAPPPPPPAASARPAKSAVLFEPPPADSSVLAGPAPSGASAAAREQAVIALLRGMAPSESFPVIATDDGGVVDPSLRERLAPRPVLTPTPPTAKGLGDL